MGNVSYTKAETAAIDKAFTAIEYLCSTTNWTDSGDFRGAYKAARKEADSKTEAQSRVVGGWYAGLTSAVEKREMARFPFGHVAWYVTAFVLGIRHAVERLDHAKTAECLELAPLSIAAGEAALTRWLEAR